MEKLSKLCSFDRQ